MERRSSTTAKKVAEILKQARREPRFRAAREGTALIDAVRFGQEDIAHGLLDSGVNPNSSDRKGKSALWHAAQWGHAGLIRELVRRGASLPDDVLMGPVYRGDVETTRFLIRKGANVNCVATYTPYHWKCPEKDILLAAAICEADDEDYSIPLMLIKAGAKVNGLAFTRPGHGPDGHTPTLLGLAARAGAMKVVRAMLKAGAAVNGLDTGGGTALHEAVAVRNVDMVNLLVAAGARIDVTRRDGATPALIARQRGMIALSERLEKLSHAA
jgi:uncharacterized protein